MRTLRAFSCGVWRCIRRRCPRRRSVRLRRLQRVHRRCLHSRVHRRCLHSRVNRRRVNRRCLHSRSLLLLHHVRDDARQLHRCVEHCTHASHATSCADNMKESGRWSHRFWCRRQEPKRYRRGPPRSGALEELQRAGNPLSGPSPFFRLGCSRLELLAGQRRSKHEMPF